MLVDAPPPPRFAALPPGWHQYDGVSSSFATSWRYRIDSPLGPGGALPRGGMLVTVSILRGPPARGVPPIRRLPLRLPATTTDRLESSPGVPEYRILGRLRGYTVDVRADIRSTRPTSRQVGLLRRIVAGLRLPAR
jgi:hypothetical protein